MALADLMKKGFLTSATLTVATVATLEPKYRGTVATVATVAVANHPNMKSVSVAETLMPWQADLVREFMEVDGMTLAEAQALAAVSVPVFPAGEWLAMIAELDDLIGIYCAAAGLTGEAKAAILSTRCGQPLASIPETLAWFRGEVARLTKPTPAPAAEKNVSTREDKFKMNWPEPLAPMQPISKE